MSLFFPIYPYSGSKRFMNRYMAHDCKLAARRSLMDCIKTVEERLPDYFSDEGLVEEEF